MKNIIKLPDGSEWQFSDDVNSELLIKVASLPYPKLRKIVSLGGVKFSSTPRFIDLISVLDEIDEEKLERLYKQFIK